MSAFSDDCFSLQVRRPITIYEPLNFYIETWNSQGQKMILPVRVYYDGHHRDHHGHHQQRFAREDPAANTEVKVTGNVKVNKTLFKTLGPNMFVIKLRLF